MGADYIAAITASLPQAAIVFDRFHVMQMFSRVIRDRRRAEFKAATTLGDLDRPADHQGQSVAAVVQPRHAQRDRPGAARSALGPEPTPVGSVRPQGTVAARLAAQSRRPPPWRLASTTGGLAGKQGLPAFQFVKTLQGHRTGICAYADHPITTSRLEAGNVSIVLLRRRARGFRDMEYLKLKIFQLNTLDMPSFLYNPIPIRSAPAPLPYRRKVRTAR